MLSTLFLFTNCFYPGQRGSTKTTSSHCIGTVDNKANGQTGDGRLWGCLGLCLFCFNLLTLPRHRAHVECSADLQPSQLCFLTLVFPSLCPCPETTQQCQLHTTCIKPNQAKGKQTNKPPKNPTNKPKQQQRKAKQIKNTTVLYFPPLP